MFWIHKYILYYSMSYESATRRGSLRAARTIAWFALGDPGYVIVKPQV